MAGAASALFLLDIKGRVLIWRDYRGDVSAVQAERFFTKLIEKEVPSVPLPNWLSSRSSLGSVYFVFALFLHVLLIDSLLFMWLDRLYQFLSSETQRSKLIIILFIHWQLVIERSLWFRRYWKEILAWRKKCVIGSLRRRLVWSSCLIVLIFWWELAGVH